MQDRTIGVGGSSRSMRASPNSASSITSSNLLTTAPELWASAQNVKPPAPRRKFNQTLDLAHLQETAEALVRDDLPDNPNSPQVQDLLLLGTSMGGARPKAVIQAPGRALDCEVCTAR